METDPLGEKSGFSRDCKMLFNYLVDAFQCKINLVANQKKYDEVNTKLKLDLNTAEDLKSYVQDLVKMGNEKFGQELFKETGSKLTEFSTAAIEQLKSKISTASSQKAIDIEGLIASERTKFMKDVEAYLASLKHPIIQRNITVKWVDGSYEAKAHYSVSIKVSTQNGQEKKRFHRNKDESQVAESLTFDYEFLLKANDLDLFKETLYFSNFEKGMKIPVRHAKSWITKEAVIDNEKIDRYLLSSAELSGSNLIAEFSEKDKDSKFKLVYHTAESENFLSVEYSDRSGAVDILSQPVLTQNLETEKLKEIMSTILDSTSELVGHRSKLISLAINSTDVISNFNASLLFSSMIKFLSAFYGKAISDIISDSPNPPDDMISSDYVDSKLQLLGDAADKFSEMLQHNYVFKSSQNGN